MEYLKIKNWESFQHYKDRNPPWIKLYHSILDDYEYSCLPDDSKLLLISLYMLAGRTDNKIPHDLKWIQSKSMLNKKIELKHLIKSGFISINGGDSKAIAKRYQDDTLRREETETETETEKEKNKKKFIPPPVDEVVKYFQENGYSKDCAINAFKYYEDGNWKDSTGKPVLSWKQKMRGVWFKPENKQKRDVSIQPKTYAQAQDAERRQRAAWLKEEMGNDNEKASGQGTDKVIPLLSGDTV